MYDTILELHSQISANSASAQSHIGRGAHKHISLFVTPVVYITLLAVPFATPPNLGANPKILPGATGPQISSI